MIELAVVGPALKGAADHDVYFYPYSDKMIDHAKPQAVERGPDGLTLSLAPVGDLAKGGELPSVQGVLVATARPSRFRPPTAPRPWAPPASARRRPSKAACAGGGRSLGAVAFAFLGGLILNLMPCVFPILSMKAAAFSGHGGEAVRRPHAGPGLPRRRAGHLRRPGARP